MLLTFFYAYLILVNAVGFLLMLADKQKAKRGAWRIPERTLMISALLGGSVGAILGMQIFRHKTKHPKFSIGLPLILAAQIIFTVIFVVKYL